MGKLITECFVREMCYSLTVLILATEYKHRCKHLTVMMHVTSHHLTFNDSHCLLPCIYIVTCLVLELSHNVAGSIKVQLTLGTIISLL